MSSCKDLCCRPSPCYPDICRDSCVVARNEPCITFCRDSTAVVYPPPVSVLFPGPILSSCPQHSVAGSSLPTLPYGAGGSSGGGILHGSVGYGGGYDSAYGVPLGDGYGGSYGYGGLCGMGRAMVGSAILPALEAVAPVKPRRKIHGTRNNQEMTDKIEIRLLAHRK